MNLRKTGIKMVLFGLLGIFLAPYLPASGYVVTAFLTFIIGAGAFLIFFGSFDRMDQDNDKEK